jgi:hypothetical protein
MLLKWSVRKGDQVYSWDGKHGTPDVEQLVQQATGNIYTSSDGLICGPELTPNMVFNIAADFLFGNYNEIIEWETNDKPEPGTDDMPQDATT